MNRRGFLWAAGAGASLLALPRWLMAAEVQAPRLISPGCRRSKVKIARLYLGIPKSRYPNPALDLEAEVRSYQAEFAKRKEELADVDFVVDQLVGSPGEVKALKDKLENVDGILAIHLTLGTMAVIREILAAGRPTMIFSAPYSGHEWYELSAIRREPLGRRMECLLTTDFTQLTASLRPFRALHHLREAKILNLAARTPADYVQEVRQKFGTEIKQVARERVLGLYEAVSEPDARAEANRWVKNAVAVVEPSPEEILKSCRLALAFQRLLDEEDATVMTVDCYGSMYHQLPAYPCVGFARLNDMGLGGICQSDLPCAVVHVLLQGLSGGPGFVCNPTFDFATQSAILIHCLGSTRMDGPNQPAAPYKLRSIMERQEGCTPQVRMRVGQKVTQVMLDGTSALRYFTGQIVDVPETERGCRTKITVRLDGDAEKLWQNWSAGIHRVSGYGDLSKDLAHFCRFAELALINEAV
jgi:hypothetical protein